MKLLQESAEPYASSSIELRFSESITELKMERSSKYNFPFDKLQDDSLHTVGFHDMQFEPKVNIVLVRFQMFQTAEQMQLKNKTGRSSFSNRSVGS